MPGRLAGGSDNHRPALNARIEMREYGRVTDQPQPLLPPDGVDRLRHALTRADFTSSGVAARLGPEVVAAINRGDHRAALRATTDRDPLHTLIRLFICGHTEPAEAVRAALAPLGLAEALAAGLVALEADGLRRAVDLEPYGEQWWVVADLPASARPGRTLPTDHVLGVGGASITLAGATVRRPVGAALDLGTGCGIQALHLATHAETVTATDLSPRALRFAATTAALSGQSWELLRGDLADPVAGRRFDLVVSNPPFVVGPGTATYTYRDSGRAGDAVSAEVAALAPRLLTDGGMLQYLANWLHVAGEDWRDRVAGWFAGTGCDVWAFQREVTDPWSYVNLWLGEAGPATRGAATSGWTGSTRSGSRRSASASSPPGAAATPTRWYGWRSCVSRWSRRWVTRSPAGSTGKSGSAAATSTRCSTRPMWRLMAFSCGRRPLSAAMVGPWTASC